MLKGKVTSLQLGKNDNRTATIMLENPNYNTSISQYISILTTELELEDIVDIQILRNGKEIK